MRDERDGRGCEIDERGERDEMREVSGERGEGSTIIPFIKLQLWQKSMF
jgi:hypothetical protein